MSLTDGAPGAGAPEPTLGDLVRVYTTPLVRAAALIAPFATCALVGRFRDNVTSATVVLTLVVWIVGAAATGDRLAGLLAAVSGGVWFDFFLTAPYHRLAISDSDDVEVVVLLVVIGVAVTEIALWGRRQQARAALRAGYLDGVLTAARTVAAGETAAEALVDVVARQIEDVLDVDACTFVAGPVNDPRLALLAQDGSVTRNGHAVDVVHKGLPFDEQVAIEVRRGSVVLGHFVITASTRIVRPSHQQLHVAVLLADQVAPALA
jgi:K+-sensing histidine kinase KdpD